MMNGVGESDCAVVAEKPTNEAQECAEELVEPMAWAQGNASRHSAGYASRGSVTQELARIREISLAGQGICRQIPKAGAVCP
jgi:hypothetical protein